MYADFRVEIPKEKGKITRKRIKGTTYIYYQLKREYDAGKKYSVPKSTPIGKACEDAPDMMIPNEKYLLYFPDADLPEEKAVPHRSSCLRIGAYMVLLYKSRDDSEKLFRGDKFYLGNRSLRVHSSESVTNKIFIEFVALIIRNRFYTLLKEHSNYAVFGDLRRYAVNNSG